MDSAALETPAEQPLVRLARLLLDGTEQLAALLTPEGNLIAANRAALAACGATQAEAPGSAFAELFCPLDEAAQAEIRGAIERAAGGEIARCMFPANNPSANRRGGALEFTFRPLAANDGLIESIFAEGQDATEERAREPDADGHFAAQEREHRRLQDLLAQAPAGMAFVGGPQHRWAYMNDAFLRFIGGKSAGEFLGRTVQESLPETEFQGFAAYLDQVYRSGEAASAREVKARVAGAAGTQPEESYFDFFYQPMRDSEGGVEGVFIQAIEVTGKVVARQAAEQNAERLDLAQAAAQVGTWEWDPIRNDNLLSPELHRIFGTDPADPDRVAQWKARISPSDWPRVQMLMNEGHRLGSMEFEYRYLHPTRGPRWLYCKGVRRPAETRMYGIIQDITARKQADAAAQRLAAIVESSEDAIVSKDLNGIVTSWNPAAERIFGYSAEEMIGQPITTIIPPELYADETRILATIARGERIENFETVRVRKDGQLREISLTISPVRDENGKIIGAAKIARDITQRKKAEQALRTTERLASVGRLAATVAHEINNPLEAITNLIFLARNVDSHQDCLKYLAMAEEELERVSHLTKQTLGFYRETQGATGVRLGEIVSSLLSVFAPKMRNRSIALYPEIDDSLEVQAIPGEIRQVVANLIGNSIDALNAGGQIRVRVAPATLWDGGRRRGVRLTIADTGCGIPAKVRTRLFEPFFTTKKDVGTGLGLWISKSIVENHQGVIQVRSSTAPGKSGTVFSIFLPLAADAAHGHGLLQKAS